MLNGLLAGEGNQSRNPLVDERPVKVWVDRLFSLMAYPFGRNLAKVIARRARLPTVPAESLWAWAKADVDIPALDAALRRAPGCLTAVAIHLWVPPPDA